jgi:hypothetical protein
MSTEIDDGIAVGRARIERNLDEIEMGDVSPNRITLNLSRNGENVSASVDLDVDECVEAGIGVQDAVQGAIFDGNRLRVDSLAVDDGWNLAVATHTARGSASRSGALESAQGLLLHDGAPRGRS